MDRRELLASAVAMMGAIVLPYRPAAARASALDVLLPAGPEAERLGRLVLQGHPAAGVAGHALAASLETAAGGEPAAIRAAFARLRDGQLAALETRVVDGWVLARCETEICAARAVVGRRS